MVYKGSKLADEIDTEYRTKQEWKERIQREKEIEEKDKEKNEERMDKLKIEYVDINSIKER